MLTKSSSSILIHSMIKEINPFNQLLKQKARRNPKTVPGESQCFTQYLLLSDFYSLLSEEDSVAVCSVKSAVGRATSLVGVASLTDSSSPSSRLCDAILSSLCASISLTLFLKPGESPNHLQAPLHRGSDNTPERALPRRRLRGRRWLLHPCRW